MRPLHRLLLYILPIFVLSGIALFLYETGLFENISQESTIDDNRFLLDTIVTIRLYESEHPENLERAFALIESYERLFSRYHGGSDTARINNLPEGEKLAVSPDTIELMNAALEYADLSGGRFDPTIGPLVDLWGIGTETPRIPTYKEISSILPLVDYNAVDVNSQAGTIELGKSHMTIDLGGIAKGWIADKVVAFLRENGEKHILVNLGGNVLVSGGKPDDTRFRIGVQDPFADRGVYLGVFALSSGSVVSSGVYERFFDSGGIRYHHILDTTSGFPVDNELAAVSVISEKSIDGDALSTALFAMGLEDGLALVSNLATIDAAFITKDNRIVITEGAANKFEVTAPNFHLEIRNR